jgi:hypothetical protein
MDNMEKIATKVLASVKAMVPGRFETELASEATHPYVDWNAYYAVRETASALGFHHLGDVDVTSVYQDPAMLKRAVLAVYVSADGTEIVGHYRVSLRWTLLGILARFMGVRGDIFDVGTSFGGGRGVVVETTTAEAAAVWLLPDFVARETLKHGTPLEDVVIRHRERVREHRAQHPTARVTVVRTLQETFAVSDMLEKRKLEWRRELGWATRDEIARLSKMNGTGLDELYAAFRRAADEA